MATPERWALSAVLGGAPLQMIAVKLRWVFRLLLAGSLKSYLEKAKEPAARLHGHGPSRCQWALRKDQW